MPPKPAPGHLGEKIAGELEAVTLMKVTKVGFENAQNNALRIKKGQSILALREDADLMKGDSALVIAAGPSIHRFPTAEMIKKSKFSGTIIATESSMAWCLRNDIVPDLVVTLDPHPTRIARWFGDPELTEEAIKKDDYYARQDMDPKFHDQLRFNKELIGLINRHGPKMAIAVASAAAESVVKRVEQSRMKAYWWNPMYDDYDKEDSLTKKIHQMNGLPCINAGGNVGSACWVFAHTVLKKKHVAVVGMDLGYYADTTYKQTQYYYEIIDLVGEDRLDEVYVHINNPHLKKDFYTDPAYLWYRNIFLDMAANAGCATYNCTGGGILFGPNVNWMDLPDFLNGKRVETRELQAK